MSAKSSSVSLSMRREATALIAMHTYHMLVNVRLASREHNHSGTTWRENERLGTHNVIPTANSECHTVTNKLWVGVDRNVGGRIVAICVPVYVTVKGMMHRDKTKTHIASVPSPVKDVGNRTSNDHNAESAQNSHSSEMDYKSNCTVYFEMGDLGRHL